MTLRQDSGRPAGGQAAGRQGGVNAVNWARLARGSSLLDPRGGAGDLGFEVSDAAVLEAQVGTGGLEAFVEGAFVGGELADALFL